MNGINCPSSPRIMVVLCGVLQKTNDCGKRYYFSYLASHLQHQVAAIQAGFGIGLLSKDFINRTANLELLGADEGFPKLPSYQYRLIGDADTHIKQKIEQPLKDFVANIRD